MERRRFIKNLTIGTTLAALPFSFLDKVLKDGASAEIISDGGNPLNITKPWDIDYSTKTIKYTGNGNESFSLDELYSFIMENWDTNEGEIPIERRGEHTYYYNINYHY